MSRLTKLSIKGYRSIGDSIEIRFPPRKPVVLLGENNAGKSNIVRALNLMLGQYWPGSHDPDDNEYYERDPTSTISISLFFDDDDALGGKWTELRWRCDAGIVSFSGVSPWIPKPYVSNDDRDDCACVLIEADRNLRYQMGYSSKYTMMSRMMRRFHKLLSEKNDIKDELEKLFESTKSTFHKLPEFKDFVDALREELANLVGSMTHKLEVDFEAYNPVNFFQALQMQASEDGEPRTLEEMGTGEQQVLAMAFANAYAKSFHTGVLLVIEEPEAHLHPLAQKWLARRIAQMCEVGLQVVVTTHSSAFIDMLNIEGLVLVTKDEDGTDVTQIDREELVKHCIATGAPPAKIDVDNVLPFYAANASREILEGFFAKVVLLVEGPSEALSLPLYLERVGLDTAKEGVAVIAVHGKGNLGKWRRLFTAYDIPCYVIFDNDSKADDEKGVKRRDALTSLGVTDPTTQDAYLQVAEMLIDEDFALFGTNFEEALGAKFPKYKEVEEEGRNSGVDSKPFLARYVAEHIQTDESDGWKEMASLAQALRDLF